MDFFECDVPSGDGLCSDNACPCLDDEIPRGSGYLYIEQSLINFRRQYPKLESARRAMQVNHEKMQTGFGLGVSGTYRLGPILVCEKGAKLRKLDLEVAAKDAQHWWKTGLVPLRATPLGSKKLEERSAHPAEQAAKPEIPENPETPLQVSPDIKDASTPQAGGINSSQADPPMPKVSIKKGIQKMECYAHPAINAVGTCMSCGKAICTECVTNIGGKIYCRDCSASGVPFQQAARTNGLSIASMVLGILALPLSCCYGGGILFGIVAFILGLIGRRQIAESNNTQSGDGMALAGIITGGVGVLISLAFIVLLIIVVVMEINA